MSGWVNKCSPRAEEAERRSPWRGERGPGDAGTVAAAGTELTAELGCGLLLEGQVEACPLASCLL